MDMTTDERQDTGYTRCVTTTSCPATLFIEVVGTRLEFSHDGLCYGDIKTELYSLYR